MKKKTVYLHAPINKVMLCVCCLNIVLCVYTVTEEITIPTYYWKIVFKYTAGKRHTHRPLNKILPVLKCEHASSYLSANGGRFCLIIFACSSSAEWFPPANNIETRSSSAKNAPFLVSSSKTGLIPSRLQQ